MEKEETRSNKSKEDRAERIKDKNNKWNDHFIHNMKRMTKKPLLGMNEIHKLSQTKGNHTINSAEWPSNEDKKVQS